MPELPEVETIRRGLNSSLRGKRITGIETNRKGMRFPFPKDFANRLKGKIIEKIERRAKYLLLYLSGGDVLLIHLGMSGRLIVEKGKKKERAKHDHVIFRLSENKVLRFNDPRRFGMCDIVSKKDLFRHKLLKNLGIEPLSRNLKTEFLEKKFHGKKTTIKTALMDQRIIAGLGNIYACETLFFAGIDPREKAGECSKEQIRKLADSIPKVLKKAIKAGGSSLRDYVRSDGTKGGFQNHFAVYGREGKKCPSCSCNFTETGGIKRITQNGRSTFFCPHKQK